MIDKQKKNNKLINFYRNIDKSIQGFYYELIIGIFALFAVIYGLRGLENKFYFLENAFAFCFITLTLVLFTFDYVMRLVASDDKKRYVKSNVLLLLSIIPFSSFFRFARILRIFSFFKQFHLRISKYFINNGLIYSLYAVILLLIGSASLFYHFEKTISVTSYSDSIWWAIVTATTVGYGDIIPKTTQGRIIGEVLMLSGVVLLGLLTATFTSYTMDKQRSFGKGKATSHSIESNYSKLNKSNKDAANNYMMYLVELQKKEKH